MLLAEQALVLLHGLPIPQTPVMTKLMLCPDPPGAAKSLPLCDAYPTILSLVNEEDSIPSASSIFRMLRTFGPLKTMEPNSPFGYVVQYWKEEDSQKAQQATLVIEGSHICLNAYDPRAVYCHVRARRLNLNLGSL